MTDGDDDTLPIVESSDIDSDVLGEVYEDSLDNEPSTLDDWKTRDMGNSFVA